MEPDCVYNYGDTQDVLDHTLYSIDSDGCAATGIKWAYNYLYKGDRWCLCSESNRTPYGVIYFVPIASLQWIYGHQIVSYTTSDAFGHWAMAGTECWVGCTRQREREAGDTDAMIQRCPGVYIKQLMYINLGPVVTLALSETSGYPEVIEETLVVPGGRKYHLFAASLYNGSHYTLRFTHKPGEELREWFFYDDLLGKVSSIEKFDDVLPSGYNYRALWYADTAIVPGQEQADIDKKCLFGQFRHLYDSDEDRRGASDFS